MLPRIAIAVWLIVLPLTADVGAGPVSVRWEKQDASGRALAMTQGPWACVYDRHTGLLWEVKSDNEGWHYAGSTYFRELEKPRYDGGCVMAPHEVKACDHDFLLRHVRQKALCGYRDWRVPTATELQSLVMDTGIPGQAKTAVGLFPHTGRAPYWTADERLDEGGVQVALIDFGTGQRQWAPVQIVARLRLVRGQPRSASRSN